MTRAASWICRLLAAVILAQTLFFKFAASPESVAIFSALDVEPWGRIATGVLELITVVLLLVPATAFAGGLLGVGLMLGAIGAHLTRLGIEVAGDGGLLFGLALVTLVASVITVVLERRQLRRLLSWGDSV
jgi:hypothetical protein